MMNKIKNNIYRLLLAVAVCLAAWSCSGEEEALMPQLPQVPADPDALCTITPGAIEIDYVDASEAPLTRSATGEPLQKATLIQNLGHNLSVEATLEAEPQEAQTRAPVSMAANAQYRIVVFDGSGKVVGNVVYKQVSGKPVLQSTTPIKLRAGTYRLFCYSFNRDMAIRDLNTDKKNVNVRPGDDFMTYTNANFTVAPTDYASGKTINISFTRQCTRLTVKVNSDREDGATNYISTAIMTISSSFGSTNWNGATNDDTSTLPSQTGNVNLVNTAGFGGYTLYCGIVGNKYLITSPITNQTVFVTNLEVTYTSELVKAPNSYPVKFTNITLNKGKSYELVINVHNFYELTASNPVKIGNVEWAWTNLWYLWNGPKFRDYPWGWDPEIAYRYWNWGVRYPGNSNTGNNSWTEAGQNHENQDPCSVFPSQRGEWRLPTKLQLDYQLIPYKAPKGTKIKINNQFYNVDNDYGYAKYINGMGALEEAGTVFIDGDQVLYLHAEGYRYGSNALNGTIEGYIWSSDNVPNSTDEAYLLKFDKNTLATFPGERFYGRSVRCVHNTY